MVRRFPYYIGFFLYSGVQEKSQQAPEELSITQQQAGKRPPNRTYPASRLLRVPSVAGGNLSAGCLLCPAALVACCRLISLACRSSRLFVHSSQGPVMHRTPTAAPIAEWTSAGQQQDSSSRKADAHEPHASLPAALYCCPSVPVLPYLCGMSRRATLPPCLRRFSVDYFFAGSSILRFHDLLLRELRT